MYKIETMDHYGRGITYVNDKVTFVDNALPDEIVDLKITNEKKNYNEGIVTNYQRKSLDRCHNVCEYYDNCGGCNIMHLNYKNQLKFKQDKVNNIIKKYLKCDIKINDIVPSDNIFNYRNKTTFQVNKIIGFCEGKSHELIKIDKCPISSERINNSIKYLNELDLKSINKIICRTCNNKLMILIDSKAKDIDITPLKVIADSIYIKYKDKFIHVFKDKYLYETLGEYKYLISPDSFFQININVCEKLYTKIKDYVGVGKNVLDLYCGTGSIGIFVSKENNVVGIEKNKYAIEDANKNIELNNLKNIKFICGDSGIETKRLKFNPDVIIVDPPRSGLNDITIKNIISFNAPTLIYVSCDPMTLTRDLNILKDFYEIKEITPFDMFPNTYHCEVVTLLERR